MSASSDFLQMAFERVQSKGDWHRQGAGVGSGDAWPRASHISCWLSEERRGDALLQDEMAWRARFPLQLFQLKAVWSGWAPVAAPARAESYLLGQELASWARRQPVA